MINNKNYLSIILLAFTGLLISNNAFARCEANEELPLRKVFLSVDCIDSDSLAQKIKADKVILVDTRTKTEYKTIKIKNAIHIDLDNKKKFISKLKKLRLSDDRDIAFYCNGKNCSISYRAGKLANEVNIRNTYVYDAGIFEFSLSNPKSVLLFDKPISETNKLISSEKLNKKMISGELFEEKITQHVINSEKFRILDVRDRTSHNGASVFIGVGHEKYIPLDRLEKLEKFLKSVAKKNEPLYVYDWSGLKLKWVQYYIEKQNIEHYYFLKGGAFKKINNDLAKLGLPALSY